MRPTGYKEKKGNTIFIYRFRDMREFITQGKETGDVGMIVISRDPSGMVKYKGFGTIEHPMKEIMTITLKHNELFDGKWNPSKMIGPVKPNDLQSYKFALVFIGDHPVDQRRIRCGSLKPTID